VVKSASESGVDRLNYLHSRQVVFLEPRDAVVIAREHTMSKHSGPLAQPASATTHDLSKHSGPLAQPEARMEIEQADSAELLDEQAGSETTA
jgi:hypothetical protein